MAFSYKPFEENEETKRTREAYNNYGAYEDSDSVKAMMADRSAREAQGAPQYENRYAGVLDELRGKLSNRPSFAYDVTGDALYQQYKDQYINQGRLAMADTMGQASALTGGYGNSYAATVGNQAYQGYLQKLNDVVPQLYQMAYDRYRDEGNDLLNQYNLYNQAEQTEYGRHRDEVGDYYTALDRLDNRINADRSFDYGKWSDQRNFLYNAANDAYTRDYGMYSDAYNRALAEYQQQVSEDQWNKTYELQKKSASRSGGGGGGTPRSYDIKNIDTVKSELNNRSSKASQRSYLESARANGWISEATYNDLYDSYDLYNNYPSKNSDGLYTYDPYNYLGSASKKIERDGRLLK